MELVEIYDKLRNLDKVISPEDCNLLSGYIGGFLQDFEEELFDLELKVSQEWLKIKETHKTAAETDKLVEVGDTYQRKEKVKMHIAQLKRMRQDLRSRFEVLTNKRYLWEKQSIAK